MADTPAALKSSVPGSNVIEAHFDHAPPDWEKRLHTLTGVTSVQHEGAGMYRVAVFGAPDDEGKREQRGSDAVA